MLLCDIVIGINSLNDYHQYTLLPRVCQMLKYKFEWKQLSTFSNLFDVIVMLCIFSLYNGAQYNSK